MSPVYLNYQPPSSPIPFLEFKGDQLLGHIHDLATSSSSSSLSYSNLDKNHTYDESLAIEYSRLAQEIKVDKVLESSSWSQNREDGSGYTTYGYSSNHCDRDKNMEIVANNNINDQKYSRKWKPSKVKIMQKMMATSKNNMGEQKLHRDLDQQGSNLSRNINNIDGNNGVIIRVCSDCHTTTTPLWRSGPRGPKSLCNACGIRQRKARRAAMAAAGFASDGIAASTAVETPKPKAHQEDHNMIRDHHKGFDNKSHPLPLKKRGKTMDVARNNNNYGNSYNNGLLSSSKDYITTTTTSQRAFPRDEEEGAILLMALSCGLACSL